MGKSCTAPWGERVEDGYSVTAYKDKQVKYGDQPESEQRWCHDGELSGSFGNKECLGLPEGVDKAPGN